MDSAKIGPPHPAHFPLSDWSFSGAGLLGWIPRVQGWMKPRCVEVVPSLPGGPVAKEDSASCIGRLRTHEELLLHCSADYIPALRKPG